MIGEKKKGPVGGTGRGVRSYAIALILYGVFNLLGSGDAGQFYSALNGLPRPLIMAVYVFVVLYSICCVYCGVKVLKMEDWARRLIIVLAGISVILGIALNRLMMEHFRVFLASGASGVDPAAAEEVLRYIAAVAFVFTLFELSVIYFFTRPGVAARFKNKPVPGPI